MRAVAPPAGGDETPSASLRALIAAEGGSISVERFMREALYHPRFGYYARRVRAVGRAGDFSTAATLHPALGEAVAAWAARHRGEVARRGRWHLIELGGGGGELAATVLHALGWRGRLGLRYHLVEISDGLRAAQQRRLGAAGGRVCWHGEAGAALEAAGGRALIFSNEFADAFPCMQLARDPETGLWREVRVIWPENAANPGETLADWNGPVPDPSISTRLTHLTRLETNSAILRYFAELIRQWHAGRLLTIDYGDTAPALWRAHPRGTLRAYCRHLRFTGLEVYQRFGQQDLTADMNFTGLKDLGSALGLRSAGLCTQAEFLRRWLPRSTLARTAREPALAHLLDPTGAGAAFKVLEQVR